MSEFLRIPPHSAEAEQSLLGALLLDNHAFERVADLVGADDFYNDNHRRIWRHIARLIDAGVAADVVTVAESITASEDKDKTGGPEYLGKLAEGTPSAINIRRYAELVRERSIQRRLAQIGSALAERALNGLESPLELADELMAALMAVQAQADRGGGASEFGAAMVEAVEWADNPKRGLATGWPALDSLLRGLMPGDLIVVAGRPSMGKTALAMNIAEHVAAKLPVAILSLEMTRRKIAARALKYHESILGRDQALDHLYGLKLYIDDSASLTLSQARTRLRRVKQQHGLALVVVDYLQMLTAKADKRHEEVALISRGLKAMAKDLDVPIVAVAQLNRAAEGRTDNRPQLADLRESGQIEQDADVVAFVYREEYYRPDTEWKGIAEVIVRKNRDGATGTAHLEFLPELTRFKTLERELPKPLAPAPTGPRRTVVKADFKRAAAGDN